MNLKPIYDYLEKLSLNNNREWYHANKEEYLAAKGLFELFAQEVLTRMQTFDDSLKGIQIKDCIFKIHRDIRFRKDKTPYKTHFGVYLAEGGRKSQLGGYYIHLQPGMSMIAGGIYCPEPSVLKRLRTEVYENIDEFKEIIAPFEKEGYTFFEEDALKKTPMGFPKDFPDAHYLKFKHYCVGKTLDDSMFLHPEAVQRAIQEMKKMISLNLFLNYTFTQKEEDQMPEITLY